MCRSVSQCVAVCRSVLQFVGYWREEGRRVRVRLADVRLCVAMCCSVYRVCSSLDIGVKKEGVYVCDLLMFACVLQCVAVCCSVLQCVQSLQFVRYWRGEGRRVRVRLADVRLSVLQ